MFVCSCFSISGRSKVSSWDDIIDHPRTHQGWHDMFRLKTVHLHHDSLLARWTGVEPNPSHGLWTFGLNTPLLVAAKIIGGKLVQKTKAFQQSHMLYGSTILCVSPDRAKCAINKIEGLDNFLATSTLHTTKTCILQLKLGKPPNNPPHKITATNHLYRVPQPSIILGRIFVTSTVKWTEPTGLWVNLGHQHLGSVWSDFAGKMSTVHLFWDFRMFPLQCLDVPG